MKKPKFKPNIKEVILPNKPKLDPIAAFFILKHYGRKYFKGLKSAKISFWTKFEDPSPEQIKQWEENGVLLIDVGKGTFDHHGKKDCAAVLAAKYIEKENNILLQNLLQYCQEDEKFGLHNKYGDLAYIIKCMYKNNVSAKKVIKYTMLALESMQAREYNWYITLKKECEQKAKTFKVKQDKRKLKITVIKSDYIDISNYIRFNLDSAVIIQQRSSGHIFIFTNKKYKIDLKPIIQAIRLRELELNNKPTSNIKNLFKTGKHPNVENWYYHTDLNAILNGTDSFYNAEPTKIPLEEIFQFVVNGISTEEPVDKNPLYYNYGFPEYKKNKKSLQ